MNITETKLLLDKYLDGQTTEAEEEQLRSDLKGDVPAELSAEKAMFEALAALDAVADAHVTSEMADAAGHRMSRLIDQLNRVETNARRKSRGHAMRWIAGVAASMMLLVGIAYYTGTAHHRSPLTAQPAALTAQPTALTAQPAALTAQPAALTAQPVETYNDPQMAYKETERVLELLSENLNKGIKKMEELKKTN